MLLPPTFTRLNNALDDRKDVNFTELQSAIKRVELEHRYRAERATEDARAIRDATYEFVETGVANLRKHCRSIPIKEHSIGWDHLGWDWSQYFRLLAKEMGRPYVRVERWGGGIRNPRSTLTMPRLRRLDPLLAPLLLLGAVETGVYSTLYEFTLHNEQVETLLTAFTNNRKCRLALGLAA